MLFTWQMQTGTHPPWEKSRQKRSSRPSSSGSWRPVLLPSPLTPLAATPGWTRELVSKFRRRWEGRFLFYQDIYTNREQVLLCEDYKEMVEIALKLLRSELPGSLPGRRLVLFTRPSSWHGACVQQKPLPFPEKLTTARKSSRTCSASLSFRSPSTFLTSWCPALYLMQLSMISVFTRSYGSSKILMVIGEEALKTLECHLWYLSDLTIPTALFSEKVDTDIKAKHRCWMSVLYRIWHFGGKRKFEARELSKAAFPLWES